MKIRKGVGGLLTLEACQQLPMGTELKSAECIGTPSDFKGPACEVSTGGVAISNRGSFCAIAMFPPACLDPPSNPARLTGSPRQSASRQMEQSRLG